MKRFRFPLARVLRLVERKEEVLRSQLAKALQGLRSLRAQVDRVSAALEEALVEADSLSPARCMARAYHETLAWRKRILSARVSKAGEEVILAREAWLTANKRKMSLERLREIRQEEHMFVQGGMEQREIEELASLSRTSRRGRRKGS